MSLCFQRGESGEALGKTAGVIWVLEGGKRWNAMGDDVERKKNPKKPKKNKEQKTAHHLRLSLPPPPHRMLISWRMLQS